MQRTFLGKTQGIREGNWEGNWKGTGREPSSLSQFPSRIPCVFPRKVRCRFFCLKKFLLKKVAAHFPLEKHGESAKGTGRELGKGKGTEKHSTSYTLKKRNKKNTAFSITPGKGNWKNSAFSITPGKGTGKTMKNTAPSRHGQLKWVLSSTIMAISCDDLFFEKQQVCCQCN